MAQIIASHPTVRELYADRLAEEGVVPAEEAEQLDKSVETELKAAHERLKELRSPTTTRPRRRYAPGVATSGPVTAVAAERLRELDEELLLVPDHFTVHPKLLKQLERRPAALEEGGIDWGHAEALAFSSLLVEGIPIRLTGQDTERGTFGHRHLVLHDAHTGERYAPIQHLSDATASFEVHNSPLSEYACVGFEYGYAVAAPEALVLWEAQFGDFVNGAQIMLDQFVVAGLSKWGETSRLTLLLPHGYEGNGPEHSSARLERFLQSTAQDNIRVVNPSTAAQYFHLLRRQALEPVARPLVVMTPKGLLRLKEAASSLADLAEGSFQPVLDDPNAATRSARGGSSSAPGRSITTSPATSCARKPTAVAVARIEQLYPFPSDAGEGARRHATRSLQEVVWAQEEPQNMGAWRSIRHRLEEAKPEGRAASLCRPPLAGEPQRGLPDGAPARAGPHRPRSARQRLAKASCGRLPRHAPNAAPASRPPGRTAGPAASPVCAASAAVAARRHML